MNKENAQRSSHDHQDHSHKEGAQQNIAPNSRNNSQEMSDINVTKQGAETESDRANKNEDEDTRGGNSSI
jgi:hypothetical protein